MSGRNSVVECQLPKLDVAGSSPVARSNLISPKFQKRSALKLDGRIIPCAKHKGDNEVDNLYLLFTKKTVICCNIFLLLCLFWCVSPLSNHRYVLMSGPMPTFLFSEQFMDEVKEKIRQLAEPVIASEEIELIHVECIKMHTRWIIRLYLDKEGGVTIDDCANASNQLGDIF